MFSRNCVVSLACELRHHRCENSVTGPIQCQLQPQGRIDSTSASPANHNRRNIVTRLAHDHCYRNHKVRNVVGHLPREQHDQAQATMKAAFKLPAEEGQYATWLEREWPSAAGSLREGLSEQFTINRLGLPLSLRRCLGTTNLIDNCHSAVRERTRRVKHWQDGMMALRWTAASFAASAENFGLRAPVDARSGPGRADARHATCPRDESRLTSFKPSGRHQNFPLAMGHHPAQRQLR